MESLLPQYFITSFLHLTVSPLHSPGSLLIEPAFTGAALTCVTYASSNTFGLTFPGMPCS